MAAVSKSEFGAFTALQKEIHTTDPNNPSEVLEAHHLYEFRKITWSSQIDHKLTRTNTTDDCIFTVATNYHYLLYLYKSQTLPAIKVKDEHAKNIRIAWCHNIENNSIVSSTFKVGDEVINTFDSVSLDILSQGFGRPGFDRHDPNYRMEMEKFEKWNSYLPPKPVQSHQPFYFAEDRMLSFPLWMIGTSVKVEFNYNLRRDIEKLLRVGKIRKDGTIANIKFDMKYIDVSEKLTKIPLPNLIGRYSFLSDQELNEHKCNQKYSFYVKDMISTQATNPGALGAKVEIPLQTPAPCLAMCWVAENLKATRFNNRSNYTTNSVNLNEGYNPCQYSTMKYKNDPRFLNFPHSHFDEMQPRYHFPTRPFEPGYNFYSIANKPASIQAEVGVPLSNVHAMLSVTLGNPDPFNVDFNNLKIGWDRPDGEEQSRVADFVDYEDEDDEIDMSSSISSSSMGNNGNSKKQPELFHLHVRMLVMHKLTATAVLNSDGKVSHYSMKMEA